MVTCQSPISRVRVESSTANGQNVHLREVPSRACAWRVVGKHLDAQILHHKKAGERPRPRLSYAMNSFKSRIASSLSASAASSSSRIARRISMVFRRSLHTATHSSLRRCARLWFVSPAFCAGVTCLNLPSISFLYLGFFSLVVHFNLSARITPPAQVQLLQAPSRQSNACLRAPCGPSLLHVLCKGRSTGFYSGSSHSSCLHLPATVLAVSVDDLAGRSFPGIKAGGVAGVGEIAITAAGKHAGHRVQAIKAL